MKGFSNRAISIIIPLIAVMLLTFNQVSASDPPNTELVSPPDGYVTTSGDVNFTCSATDDENVFSISLYHDINGTFESHGTKSIMELESDSDTLLLCRFNDNYTCEGGEEGTNTSTDFVDSIFGKGVRINDSDTLKYPTPGNIEFGQGTLEFWLKPGFNVSYDAWLFSTGTSNRNEMQIYIEQDMLNFKLYDKDGYSTLVKGNISAWNENEWHHIAGIWDVDGLFGTGEILDILDIFLDGSNDSVFSSQNFYGYTFSDYMYLGSYADGTKQANSTFDELRISGVPRTPGEINASYLKFAGNHSLESAEWAIAGIDEGSYTWNCLAYDSAYQPGWGSSNRTFTVDRTPPVIENIKFTPSMIKLDNSSETSVLVSAEVYDELSGVEDVNISFYNAAALNSSYGEWYNQSMTESGGKWVYYSETGIIYTNSPGQLDFEITARDSAGNRKTTYGGYFTYNSTFGPEKADMYTSVSTDENNQITIDSEKTTDTTLLIQTNQGVSNASSSVAVYGEDPKQAGFGIPGLGKYVEIEVSQDISESLSWVVIRVYYTDEELNGTGIYEPNLKLYHYNESVSGWQALDSVVNPAENYVEANVTHLSLFGLFGRGEYCGDGYCTGGEVCDTCPGDCGPCFRASPGCEEDWTCSGWSECSQEGIRTRSCTDLEDCGTERDKPAETQSCVYTQPAPSPYCGDGVCQAGEDCSTCEADCGSCPPPPPSGPACGDGTCDSGESCGDCPEDCGSCPPATTPPPTGIGAITARIAENPATVMAAIIAVIIVLLAQFVVLPKVSKG